MSFRKSSFTFLVLMISVTGFASQPKEINCPQSPYGEILIEKDPSSGSQYLISGSLHRVVDNDPRVFTFSKQKVDCEFKEFKGNSVFPYAGKCTGMVVEGKRTLVLTMSSTKVLSPKENGGFEVEWTGQIQANIIADGLLYYYVNWPLGKATDCQFKSQP
jgi:hypothetical protein